MSSERSSSPSALAGLALAVVLSATGYALLEHVGRLFKALVIGLTAAIGTISTAPWRRSRSWASCGRPAFMARTSHSGSLTVVWAFVSPTLTVAYNRLYDGVLTSFSHALNAPSRSATRCASARISKKQT